MVVNMNLWQKQTRTYPDRVQAWDIYHRLIELGIPCGDSPLGTGVENGGQAIQIWCVTKAVVASRQEQVNFLEQCWKLKYE